MKPLSVCFAIALCVVSSAAVYSQTPQASPADAKQFSKDGVMFSYMSSWTLVDDSTGDMQQLELSRTDSDAKIRVFVHRGRITPDKLPEARKLFIDKYIESNAKQFIAMGAKPEQSPDSTEIGTIKAEGVNIKASLGGESGAAKIYWALINERVVLLTYLGPDRDLKKHEPAWALLRGTLHIEPKAKPAAKPSPTPK